MKKSDADLVLKAKEGDQAAMGDIYDRYADRLFGFAFSMLRDREEAADAVHDVILRSSQKLDQLRDPAKLRPWLFSIARNEVMSRMRQRSRRDNREVPDMAADLPENDHEILQNELQKLVWDAADALQPRDRQLLEFQMQGLEGEELAEALGVKVSHVHVLSSRMKDRMEKAVGSLLIARLGRDDCENLDRLLSDWDGKFSLETRSKVTRHIEDCDTCTKKRAVLCAPGSIALALPIVAVPVTLKGKVLSSIGHVNNGNEPGYTNEKQTEWDWDVHSGFPTKTTVISKSISAFLLATSVAVIATAIVIGSFLAFGSDGEPIITINNTEVSANSVSPSDSETVNDETEGEIVEDEDQESSTNTPNSNIETFTSDFRIIQSEMDLTCIEGDYCSFTAYLSDNPLDIISLIPGQVECLGSEITGPKIAAKWDPRNWESRQHIQFLAIDDNLVQGDRECEIGFTTTGMNGPIDIDTLSVTFTILDDDEPLIQPTPLPNSKLNVNTSELIFGSEANSRELVISNDGDQPINWVMSVQGSQFETSVESGQINGDTSVSIKIIFNRQQAVEGNYEGILILEGENQIIRIDLSGQVEIQPSIESFFSDPKVVYITNSNCGNGTASIGARVSDDSPLITVEAEWTRNGTDSITTPLQLTSNQVWVATLAGFETGAVPSVNVTLRVVDSRGNESSANTVIGVRLC